jgi:hypothetical protein
MNRSKRLLMCVPFLGLGLFASPSSLAQGPFEGTWRINLDQSKPVHKSLVISMNNGFYDCLSCSPQIHIKADGTDQPLPGQTNAAMNIREIDPQTVAFVAHVGGKVVNDFTRTVSKDGNTLTEKGNEYQSDRAMSFEDTFTRVGKAPAGASRISGSWRRDKAKAGESGLITTYETTGGDLSMSTPTGQSYTAKLDGKDYPVKGSYEYNTVSLKRVNERNIEETVKLDGKVIGVSKMTVAPDGKKMTVITTAEHDGGTSVFVAEKQ